MCAGPGWVEPQVFSQVGAGLLILGTRLRLGDVGSLPVPTWDGPAAEAKRTPAQRPPWCVRGSAASRAGQRPARRRPRCLRFEGCLPLFARGGRPPAQQGHQLDPGLAPLTALPLSRCVTPKPATAMRLFLPLSAEAAPAPPPPSHAGGGDFYTDGRQQVDRWWWVGGRVGRRQSYVEPQGSHSLRPEPKTRPPATVTCREHAPCCSYGFTVEPFTGDAAAAPSPASQQRLPAPQTDES